MKSLLQEEASERFATGLGVFVGVAAARAGELGLTLAEIALLNETNDAVNERLGAVAAARAALAAAITEKDETLYAARKLVSQFSRQWRANPMVPDALITELQLAPKESVKTYRPAASPVGLTLEASGDGEIQLRWEKGENPRGVVYLVQQADFPAGPWATVEVTTQRRATIQGTPGKPIWLRVSAKVRKNLSQPTLPVSVWAHPGLMRVA